jgi:molybdopterin-guanine dinucleotide biosynthesis protein A
MIQNVTAVVLAGGKSSRMGRDKSFLPLGEKNLLQIVLEILTPSFSNTLLSVADESRYQEFGVPLIVDRYHEIGPIGGICSVLEQSDANRIFCVACDMPFLNAALISDLCAREKAEAVIPLWNGRAEVLHAIYSNSLIGRFQLAIGQRKYKITDTLSNADVEYVPESVVQKYDPDGRSFENLNTPADYARITGK